MSDPKPYTAEQPERSAIEEIAGPVLLEFGTNWCGHCAAARPLVEAAIAAHPGVRHVKVEDGQGRMLGRSFRVKFWPTLVFLRDGEELARVVRPLGAGSIRAALERVDPPAAGAAQ